MRTLFGDEPDEVPADESVDKPPSIWQLIAAITHTKEEYEDLSEYTPFVVNRAIAAFPELIYHADRMNNFASLPAAMQFKYYLHAVPPKKRWKPWMKKEKRDDDLIKAICEEMSCGPRTAMTIIPLLSEEVKDRLVEDPDKKNRKFAR